MKIQKEECKNKLLLKYKYQREKMFKLTQLNAVYEKCEASSK